MPLNDEAPLLKLLKENNMLKAPTYTNIVDSYRLSTKNKKIFDNYRKKLEDAIIVGIELTERICYIMLKGKTVCRLKLTRECIDISSSIFAEEFFVYITYCLMIQPNISKYIMIPRLVKNIITRIIWEE